MEHQSSIISPNSNKTKCDIHGFDFKSCDSTAIVATIAPVWTRTPKKAKRNSQLLSERRSGITCTTGTSENKTLSKDDSDSELDDEGFFELSDEENTPKEELVVVLKMCKKSKSGHKAHSPGRKHHGWRTRKFPKEYPVSPLAAGVQPSYRMSRPKQRRRYSKQPEEPLLKSLLKARFCRGLMEVIEEQSSSNV
ncbi:hypothetical protein Y032_0004g1739 [Ancylostoma ceylanicum]|uniref:Uncharacterized protein n=1 Tax=Ancylostoma ceylanicum TaxID=53326 RepID=A0A016VVE0_9BILA|nr:hypothetical protein Y032_0004g1739 [Ancylostoma ceylanicum]